VGPVSEGRPHTIVVMGGPRRTAFWRGFVAIAPLWLGVVPFGIVYAVIARDAGLSVVETQALSLFVFAGSAQFSAAGLFATGASAVGIVLTTFLLNVRHVLYGLSLGRRITLHGWRRPTAAYFLTDEVFGVVAAKPAPTFPFLFGAELSLFLVWNLATLGGAFLGAAIPDPAKLGLDLVFPLAFLALLVPLVRTRAELGVAVASGVLAYLVAQVSSGGVPIVVTGVAGSLLGAWLTRSCGVEETRLEDAIREVA
jgi:4-azaleucine resistance transporter AzlC